MITIRQACATLLALALTVPFAYAGETVTEHESYEKRSMKVETVPPTPPADTVERTDTSRTETERRPADVEVERKTTVVPGPVIKEKKTETVTHGDDDDDD